MNIDTLKDLEAVISLCRRKGVAKISVGAISLELGPRPERKVSIDAKDVQDETPKFSDEEMMLWSSGSDLNG